MIAVIMMPLWYGSVVTNIVLIIVMHLSENRIVLKLSGWTLDLLFLRSRSYHNKLAAMATGTLKLDLECYRYEAKSSNKNLIIFY